MTESRWRRAGTTGGDGARLRRSRCTPLRRQAEPAQPDAAEAQAGGRAGPLWPHLLRSASTSSDAPPVVLRQFGLAGTWEFDGGAFMNQASHYVDLLDWIVGPVESVMVTPARWRATSRSRTPASRRSWRTGAVGSVNVTMLTYPKNLEGSITILGERGSVRVGGVAVNKIEHWEFDKPHEMDARVADASYQTTSVYGFGHPLYYDNVIKHAARRGAARDGWPRGPEIARAADRDVHVPRDGSASICRSPTDRSATQRWPHDHPPVGDRRRWRARTRRRLPRLALRAHQRRRIASASAARSAERVRRQRRGHRLATSGPEQRLGL